MARVQVDLISDGMAQLLKDDGVRAHVAGLADQVLARAEASAPVRTGAYRASLQRESVTTDRAVERRHRRQLPPKLNLRYSNTDDRNPNPDRYRQNLHYRSRRPHRAYPPH